MLVSEAMTRAVRVARPDQTIQEATIVMADIDAGVLPVGENDRLVGMITDRDIAVRAVAQGKGPQTSVREIMTSEVKYCFEDEDIDQVAGNMADQQVRRLPVVNRDKRLVGILSLGDIAFTQGGQPAGDALTGSPNRAAGTRNLRRARVSMKSSQRRTPDVHARSLLMSGFNAWRMAGPGGFRWLENQVVESYGGPGLLWIAALDPQDTGAVDADERAGSSDLGRVVDDSSLLKGGQRSLVWGAEELATHPTARRRAGAPPST